MLRNSQASQNSNPDSEYSIAEDTLLGACIGGGQAAASYALVLLSLIGEAVGGKATVPGWSIVMAIAGYAIAANQAIDSITPAITGNPFTDQVIKGALLGAAAGASLHGLWGQNKQVKDREPVPDSSKKFSPA